MAWKPPQLKIIGNNDSKVSPYLKAWVIQENTCVCGVIGEGTSKEILVQWSQPFENESLGSHFEKIGGVVQTQTGRTSLTKPHTTQIWNGAKPYHIALNLKFYALADAVAEVMDPIKEIEKMAAPTFSGDASLLPTGRIPAPVAVNIGRILLLDDLLITSIHVPLDKEKTKDGYLVRAEVQLELETKTMLERRDIDRTFG